ncbi:putative permease YjgP/YjgQ family protein, partial [Chlamydia psittaci C6/98]
QNLEV